jgi:hypothetical protein
MKEFPVWPVHPRRTQLPRTQVAVLVGVAPYDFDSGKFKGMRCIWGGRAPRRVQRLPSEIDSIRCCSITRLPMAAGCRSRCPQRTRVCWLASRFTSPAPGPKCTCTSFAERGCPQLEQVITGLNINARRPCCSCSRGQIAPRHEERRRSVLNVVQRACGDFVLLLRRAEELRPLVEAGALAEQIDTGNRDAATQHILR